MQLKASFRNDYSEGAHPRLLQALVQASAEQNAGYGLDRHSARAAGLIVARCGQPQAQVHFLVGGTQTNLLAISAFLRPHEAVIAVESGHVATHETGAIEATGHKVLVTPHVDGKLTPDGVRTLLAANTSEHMVKPRLVYVSNTTELGTIYSKAELQALRALCDAHGLLFFLDGARIGSALTAAGNDLTLADIAALTHAFYIGGTKNGALLGEALVVVDPALQADLRYLIKQRGAMLAKGMVVGAQFEALFEDDLFFELGAHANAMAQRLQAGLKAAGTALLIESPSNQVFPVLTHAQIDGLVQVTAFERWGPYSETHAVIRFVTSWATRPEAVDALLTAIKNLVR
ncbi:aminotransferase class I/II-fold pyridoxal phosphate-dependent enzyme [Pseudoxanthomonas sp.]|uniref:threonine aldolase family protein n=1 Tax=Pseudoxanthomonas sp. TaxID=1871049 RepID=UPI00261BA1C5|nr:aminotransferase class I/II-fold pyridoxal phosphate-dependent enzyme [Pseudoxanthomonas sp.]WDS35606.1 MAG: aminotransferase class I/II-fold pyridoxal phosphate-dependent enzyme [Pseudoxanthomonas sp.]